MFFYVLSASPHKKALHGLYGSHNANCNQVVSCGIIFYNMNKTKEGSPGKIPEKFAAVSILRETAINGMMEAFKEAKLELEKAVQEGIPAEDLKEVVHTVAQPLLTLLDYRYSLLTKAKENPEAKDRDNRVIDVTKTETSIQSLKEALGIKLEVGAEKIAEAAKKLDELGGIDTDIVDMESVNKQMNILEDAKRERELVLKNLIAYGDSNETRISSMRESLEKIDSILDLKKEMEKTEPEEEENVLNTLKGNRGGHDLDFAFKRKPVAEKPKKEEKSAEGREYNTIEEEVQSYLDALSNEKIKGRQKKSLKSEAHRYVKKHLKPLSEMIAELEKSGTEEEILVIAKNDLELLNRLILKIEENNNNKESAVEYTTISPQVDSYMEYLDALIDTDSPVPPKKIKEIGSYLEYHKPNLAKLIIRLEKNTPDSDLLSLAKSDYEKLEMLYSKFWPEEKSDEKNILSEYPVQSADDEKILKRDHFLYQTFSVAAHTYLENIKQGKKPTDEEVESLNRLFGQARLFIQTERERDTPPKPQKTKEQKKKKTTVEEKRTKEIEHENETFTTNTGQGINFEPIKMNHSEAEENPTSESTPQPLPPLSNESGAEQNEGTAEENPVSESTPQPLPRLSMEQIFIMRKGEAYANFSEDVNFDVWMKSLYRQMVKNNEANQDNARDIEAWHQEYVESAEYREKLIEIFADIEKSPDKMDAEISKEKIQTLLYDLYRNSDVTREKIEAIHASYRKSKENSKVKEFEDKILAMRIEIGNDRQSNRNGELKPEQIKTILESRGDENTSENISELSFFLKNLDNQYDMYMGGKKEGEPNEVVKAYRRYTAKGVNIGQKKTGFKNKILSFFGSLPAKFIATIPMSVDYKKFNEFAILIDQVRKLNLVDRKNGNKDAAAHNKHKMENLLNLMQDENDLVNKYVSNPQSIDITRLSAEKKDLLETFKTMYDKYTGVKYRGDRAKRDAESILQYRPGSISSISREDILSPVDVLFDTSSEKETFKSAAKYEITKRDLTALEKEIDGFTKKKTDNKKVRELLARFNAVEENMKKAPERRGEDDINLSKVSIKMKGLILRHANNEDPVELSSSLKTYDEVLFSPVIDKAERINYVNTLIASLEQQKKSKGNTLIQKAILNDTIEKYKEIRDQISK